MNKFKVNDIVKVYNEKTEKDHYGKVISIDNGVNPTKYVIRTPYDLLEVCSKDIKTTKDQGIKDWINRMEFVEEVDEQTSEKKYLYKQLIIDVMTV